MKASEYATDNMQLKKSLARLFLFEYYPDES